MAVYTDVSDEEQVKASMAATLERFGKVIVDRPEPQRSGCDDGSARRG